MPTGFSTPAQCTLHCRSVLPNFSLCKISPPPLGASKGFAKIFGGYPTDSVLGFSKPSHTWAFSSATAFPVAFLACLHLSAGGPSACITSISLAASFTTGGFWVILISGADHLLATALCSCCNTWGLEHGPFRLNVPVNSLSMQEKLRSYTHNCTKSWQAAVWLHLLFYKCISVIKTSMSYFIDICAILLLECNTFNDESNYLTV